jgi:hypothetical protein
MTTPAAAARYLAEYQREVYGRKVAVFNPHGKPVESLPTIYGFNNGGSDDWWHAQLLAEDGTELGSHICSHEGYMPGDLGVLEGTRPDRHEHFRVHYPDGYRMEFVSYAQARGHAGLIAAIEKANASQPEA